MSGKWQRQEPRALPPDWGARRRAVRERAAGQCEATEDGSRCQSQGSECDHAVHRDDHRIESLQWLCEEHHQAKTQREAQEGARRLRAKLRHPMNR